MVKRCCEMSGGVSGGETDETLIIEIKIILNKSKAKWSGLRYPGLLLSYLLTMRFNCRDRL
jgi:hypothetical protein